MSRSVPIDFAAIAKESGLERGKLCHSPAFGWGVQNSHGDEGPHFGCVTPPPLEGEEKTVHIDCNCWVFES